MLTSNGNATSALDSVEEKYKLILSYSEVYSGIFWQKTLTSTLSTIPSNQRITGSSNNLQKIRVCDVLSEKASAESNFFHPMQMKTF